VRPLRLATFLAFSDGTFFDGANASRAFQRSLRSHACTTRLGLAVQLAYLRHPGQAVPFLLVGDHFEFAEGHVNALPPAQFDVDTGLGGAGVNLSDELLAAAKIHLNKKQAAVGVGGAGDTQTIPYTVPTVWLGGVRRTGVTGVYDGGISPLKQQLGFTVGSVIGHDLFRPFALTFDFQRMLLVIR
jgi:hypothetical protein